MKDLIQTLLANQTLIDYYEEMIEETEEQDGKRAYKLLLQTRLSAQSSLIDSLIIHLNLEKADISNKERELSLELNKSN